MIYTTLHRTLNIEQKCIHPRPVNTRNLLVLKMFLLVLNIGMVEIKFVEHKINLPHYPIFVAIANSGSWVEASGRLITRAI
jgi:hypothetical protein